MTRATVDDPRWAETAHLEAVVRRQGLREAGRRPVGKNIEEGARLAAAAGEFLHALKRPDQA